MSLCPHNINIKHRRCDSCEEIAEAENRVRSVENHYRPTNKQKAIAKIVRTRLQRLAADLPDKTSAALLLVEANAVSQVIEEFPC